MSESLEIVPLNKPKPPCRHGSWYNMAKAPEDMPEMRFKCWSTGFDGKPDQARGMCARCILYSP